MHHLDAGGDSQLLAVNTKDGLLRWFFDIGADQGGLGIPPIVENNVLYFATDNPDVGATNPSAVYAVNLADGSQLWMEPLSGFISQLSLADNVLYVIGDDGIAYAMNANTGAVRWKSQIPHNAVNGFDLPTVKNGSSTPVATDTPAPPTASYNLYLPTRMDGPVYIVSSLYDVFFYALNANTGALLWMFKAPGQLLTATNGVGYFGGNDGYLYALNL